MTGVHQEVQQHLLHLADVAADLAARLERELDIGHVLDLVRRDDQRVADGGVQIRRFLIAGVGATYVKPPSDVAVPPGVVTATSTDPAA